LKTLEITPEEQGPPEIPAVSKGAAPAEPSPKPTLSAFKKSIVKRKLSPKHPSTQGPTEKYPLEPSAKKAKKTTPSVPSPRLAQLLQRSVVRGKIVKVQYFEGQGLGVFLEKLRAQGWLELFINTQLGCSMPDLAEVNGKKMRFDERKSGEILGIPSTGFYIYVREDKNVLGNARLLELSQKLSQQTGLKIPQSVKKGIRHLCISCYFGSSSRMSSHGVRDVTLPILWTSVSSI